MWVLVLFTLAGSIILNLSLVLEQQRLALQRESQKVKDTDSGNHGNTVHVTMKKPQEPQLVRISILCIVAYSRDNVSSELYLTQISRMEFPILIK